MKEGKEIHSSVSHITPEFLQRAKGPLAKRNDLKKVRQRPGEGLRLYPGRWPINWCRRRHHQSLFTRQDSESKATASWQGPRQNGWSFGEPSLEWLKDRVSWPESLQPKNLNHMNWKCTCVYINTNIYAYIYNTQKLSLKGETKNNLFWRRKMEQYGVRKVNFHCTLFILFAFLPYTCINRTYKKIS